MKQSIEEMLAKYNQDTNHANEVRRFGMMIFDEVCEKLHDMSNKQRKYLEAACMLHDIGYSIEAKGHNKHSMKIIIENGIQGFDFHECEIIGCICRYHRGGLPKKNEHEIYMDLDKKERKIVKRLGGILKIADGLGRGHMTLIKKVKISYDEENNIVEFLLTPNSPDFHPDITTAIRKRDLFEVGFKCQSVFKFCNTSI